MFSYDKEFYYYRDLVGYKVFFYNFYFLCGKCSEKKGYSVCDFEEVFCILCEGMVDWVTDRCRRVRKKRSSGIIFGEGSLGKKFRFGYFGSVIFSSELVEGSFVFGIVF